MIVVRSRPRSIPPQSGSVDPARSLCLVGNHRAFIGNMVIKPDAVSWFVLYLMTVGLVIVLGFQRVRLLKIALKIASATGFGG